MSRQLRRMSAVMLLLFAALFVNLNLIQVVRGDDLVENPANRRLLIREYGIERGPIVAGETAIAYSEPTDGTLQYLRRYDDPLLWSHLTGYYSIVLGRSQLEATYNDALIGAPTELLAQNLAQLLGQADDTGNTVRLSVDPHVQSVAAQALGDRVGAVVALDPTTGAVLASVSHPSYDTNLLATHDSAAINDAWDELRAGDNQPLLDRVTREVFAPGSSFKLIVAAAALEGGRIQPDTAFENLAEFDVPQTDADIGNFSPGRCGGGGESITLTDALRVSCNTVFARLGLELGAETLIGTAEAFGYNHEVPYDLPVVASRIPESLTEPETAQSAIGQFSVVANPLHQAVMVAAIVNDGVLLRPYVVDSLLDPSGRLLRGPVAGEWDDGLFDARAVSVRTANQLEDMMVTVVEGGTGTAAAIPGVRVGGKTGTAQIGADGEGRTVWFVGFAEEQVAVAVVLPNADEGSTGGSDAAPIARAVMEAVLGLR